MSPPLILLEDAYDLVDFLEATRRTIPRTKWAVESIALSRQRKLDGLY